jgi:hypothetical protein
VTFEVFLEIDCSFSITECDNDIDPLWTDFCCVGYLTGVVRYESALEIIGESDVAAVWVMRADQGVDIVEGSHAVDLTDGVDGNIRLLLWLRRDSFSSKRSFEEKLVDTNEKNSKHRCHAHRGAHPRDQSAPGLSEHCAESPTSPGADRWVPGLIVGCQALEP